MQNKAAIYHFTDKSDQRPKICKDQLKALQKFAASAGFSAYDIYCDKSLKRRERTEFDRFLSEYAQYDALITKDLYHISKNTGKCMSIMQELQKEGLQIHTIENGTFSWTEAPFNSPLRAASYTCLLGTPDEMKELIPVRNDIIELFVRKKTMWNLVDQYYDKCRHQKNGDQIQLAQLMEDRDKYDILIVHNLNDIHWRTAHLCKIREKLHMDIYSLQEGLLRYNKGI